MVDRLRALLDRRLDPSAARAILALASAILLGLAALFVLAGGEPDRPTSREERPAAASPSVPAAPVEEVEDEAAEDRPSTRRQDPQDQKGSAAARRAARALQSHRALQHVPYQGGEVTVTLTGARGSRAVLRVSAPTIPEARRGWRRFLRRYRDSGRAYVPIFKAAGSARPRGGA
ncbi:MAG TPA: hypothetical protein VFM94_02875 [Solirubrobacterales bacterium]|nr:hypothetical protein [Solirubrobacterales bacterium]